MTSDQTVFIVDDDPGVRKSLRALLEASGFHVQDYPSAKAFLAENIKTGGCLIADIRMPEMGGLELQEELVRRAVALPVIIVTGHGDVPLAVRAMRAGAIDFIEKPFDGDLLLVSLQRALDVGRREHNRSIEAQKALELISQLTPRERQVLEQLVAGRSNKLAAFELSISPRTIEIHRARIMDKLNARSLSDLVRTALAASMPPFTQH
ncbi:MAG: response regulator [Rhizomicrobium sp.]|jgi:two-component system response regulator FixJ